MWPVIGKVWVQSQGRPCRLCNGLGGTGTGFCPAVSVLSCQFHSINVPYSIEMPFSVRSMGPLKALIT